MTPNGTEHDREPDSPPVDGATPDTGDGEDAGGGLVPVPSDFLSSLPPEFQASLPEEIRAQLADRAGGSVFRAVSASMSMTLGNIVNPIASRVTPQHITDLIGITRREVELGYSDKRHNRIVWATTIAILAICITAITIVLTYNGLLEFLLEVLKLVVPIAGSIVCVIIGGRMALRFTGSRRP